MGWATIIGVGLQIALLTLKQSVEKKTTKRQQIKDLNDEFKEALKDRDYARTISLWSRSRQL